MNVVLLLFSVNHGRLFPLWVSLHVITDYTLASRPGRLKYGLVSIAWVIVHMRKLSYPESG